MRRKQNPNIKHPKLASLASLRRKADRLLQEKYVKLNQRCLVCGKGTSEMHHVVPKSQSNILRYDPDNLVPLCRGCHFRHHNTSDPYIMARILELKGMDWFNGLQGKRHEILKLNRAYLQVIITDLMEN